MTLGQRPLKIWLFVANITNEFNLGLDILCTNSASVDLGCQMLHLAEEEISLWSHGEGPWPSSPVVANDHVIGAQYKGVVMAQLKNPLRVENGLV
jgi:hypothetical protein